MKARAVPRTTSRAEALLELGEQLARRRGCSRVSSSAVRIVMSARGELQALVDGARGVADLEAEIPQQVEHVLDDALAPGRLLVGQQEQQIDVGARRQQPAAVAAGGDDRHALGVGRVGGAVDVRDRVVVDERGSARPGTATGPRRSAGRCRRPRAARRAAARASASSAFSRSSTAGRASAALAVGALNMRVSSARSSRGSK